jgi:hypothetical protein
VPAAARALLGGGGLRWLPDGAFSEGLPLLFGAALYSFEMICAVLPVENAMAEPARITTVLAAAMSVYCAVMLAVGLLPVVGFGPLGQGSLTAELGVRFRGRGDRVWITLMNALVTAAVTLTFPVQFYSAIEIIERRLGLAGAGAASEYAVLAEDDDGDLPGELELVSPTEREAPAPAAGSWAAAAHLAGAAAAVAADGGPPLEGVPLEGPPASPPAAVDPCDRWNNRTAAAADGDVPPAGAAGGGGEGGGSHGR